MAEQQYTTSSLIPFAKRQIGTEAVNTVNARDLHSFLQVKTGFNHWITRRIQTYGFRESLDFTCWPDLASGNPNPPIEYFLSFDMCKELSMVEKTAKGKEARLYFLECERRVHTQEPKSSGDMLVEMAIAYRAQEKRLQLVETQQRDTQAQVIAAQEMALSALRSMQWVTIRQYVEIYGLQAQASPSIQRAFATWLTTYCLEQGQPMYKAATADKDWPYEKTYCIATIHQTFGEWLGRRNAPRLLRPDTKADLP